MEDRDYIEAGLDISSAEERFMRNETIYLKHLYKFPYNQNYERGMQMIREDNVLGAFEELHSLKGIASNLSLVRVQSTCCDVVEMLRKGKLPVQEQIINFQDAYDAAVQFIGRMEKEQVHVFD